jgi:hypothetical protein
MWRVTWAMKSKHEKWRSLPLKYPEVEEGVRGEIRHPREGSLGVSLLRMPRYIVFRLNVEKLTLTAGGETFDEWVRAHSIHFLIATISLDASTLPSQTGQTEVQSAALMSYFFISPPSLKASCCDGHRLWRVSWLRCS